MDCARLHEVLDAYLDGALSAAEARDCARHVERCAECSDVVATLRQLRLDRELVLDPVLHSTTGAACRKVREWLAGDDEAAEAAWAAEHVEACADCHRVHRALEETHALLPSLAEVDPGPNFTADVLMATLEQPSLLAVARTRVGDFWSRLVERPAFASEFSFAVTVFLVLLTATPWSPLPQLPRTALEAVQSVGAMPIEGQGVGALESWASMGVVSRAKDFWIDEVHPRARRVGGEAHRLGADAALAGRGLLLIDFDQVQDGIRQIGCDLERMWLGMRAPEEEPQVDCDVTRAADVGRRS